ncbi:MAG: PilZ domain-containing protein [Candidatus Omnitrophota bacterium]|nr:PilZ domain-containing protein [Candidatus Omnitrophota bacterium]
MIWEGINQRNFPRVSYKCRIRVSTDGREEVIETFTENIGAGGICVVLEKGFGLFEVVSLEIFIEDEANPILCEGTIVWVVKRHPVSHAEMTRYDTGIEFQNINQEDKDRISKLVEDILRSEA